MSVQNQSTTSTVPKWRVIGPGLVVAATGVGAADLVATLIAGQKFGYTLLWCVVVGCLMKIVLVEGAGRYSLATGRTIFEGWRSLGRWTTWYFGPYILLWGFVYGATAMSSAAMPLARAPGHERRWKRVCATTIPPPRPSGRRGPRPSRRRLEKFSPYSPRDMAAVRPRNAARPKRFPLLIIEENPRLCRGTPRGLTCATVVVSPKSLPRDEVRDERLSELESYPVRL